MISSLVTQKRGEMVTGAAADANITDLNAGRTDKSGGHPDILDGRYQLEIRRVGPVLNGQDDYVLTGATHDGDTHENGEGNEIRAVFDTNLRHVQDDISPEGLLADRNRERAQGVFILESNFISDSLVLGINVEPGVTQAGGNVPHPGSTINFPQINAERLVPGIVIENNVISGSSGVRFAGEANPNPQRPVPFGRIVNNTIVGAGRLGTGIDVAGIASPTLINNILTDLGQGISDSGTNGTVIRSNFFQNNATNGAVGTDAITAAAGSPLFLDPANGNYILQAGSAAVDSSQNTEQDRLNFLNFKTEIGIPASPIVAPELDIYGQLRVDSNANSVGGGSEIFKDRGAVDRADSDAPYAILLNPVDNDSLGRDTDPTETIVRVTDPFLENFRILLGDGPNSNEPFEGTGVDQLTVDDPADPDVSARAVMVMRNREFLTEGVDYVLSYNELTGVLSLTPLSTLWEPTGVYTIMLDNTLIADRVGNLLRPNQEDGSTKFTIIMPYVEIDFGDAPDTYSTSITEDGARHAIIVSPGDLYPTPRLGQYVDGETDALIENLDDATTVIVDGNPSVAGDLPFALSSSAAPEVTLQLLNQPEVGDTLSVTSENETAIFELVLAGKRTTGYDRVPVFYQSTDTLEDVMTSLANVMVAEFSDRNFQASVAHTPGVNEITIIGEHDEDGISIGRFNGGAPDPLVFVTPGTSPFDVQTKDIVGFLNPNDPFGTNVPVVVAGSGLLQAWVDFDQSGTFEAEEQVITDEPVSDVNGALNTLTIFTPEDAVEGETWLRVRVSKDEGVSPDTFVVGGEVEDHRISVVRVDVPIFGR